MPIAYLPDPDAYLARLGALAREIGTRVAFHTARTPHHARNGTRIGVA